MALLRVENLGLDVPLYVQSERIASSWLGTLGLAAFARPTRELVTLLDGVSFEAAPGDRVAILGRNGAGKSTLLQVLTGAYRPTRGALTVGGSRQALMNISLGFNAEATVLENILLRSSAMGTPLTQVRDLIPSILEFSGLEGKINHRLKTLSSGQRMRLGFSISTSVQHDIMIMDEWIGTGDAEFIEKARQRMSDRVDGSQIVVIATHSIALVRKVCNKAILLDGGRMRCHGSVSRVINYYQRMIREAAPVEFGGKAKELEEAN